MNIFAAILIVIILVLVFYIMPYEAINTVKTAPCVDCEPRNVHRMHDKKVNAAELLAEIVKRIKILMQFLKDKYQTKHEGGIDPYKSNTIDIVNPSAIYEEKWIKNPEYINERINQLFINFDEKNIYEISPINRLSATSYTEDKVKLVFCLRNKIPDINGEYQLHDCNIVMYVVLHELSHMMNTEYDTTKDHGADFWDLFRFLLKNGYEAGIYIPKNYNKHPEMYCGMNITYTPFFIDGV